MKHKMLTSETLTETTLEKARRQFLHQDDPLAPIVRRMETLSVRRESDAWRALTGSIIGQQVSVHAARAIRNRFAALDDNADYPTPARVLSFSEETLRGCGLSRNKMLSILDLARHFEEDLINQNRLSAMGDEEVIAALIPVRGIGRWTAEMFLVFSLGRPDVFAADDVGIRNALIKLFALQEKPTSTQMVEMAARWKPYRSVAMLYLWRSLDNMPPVAV